MPEKGWKILTVREGLHRKLVDQSRKAGTSINDFIESKLTGQGLRKPKQTSKGTSQRQKSSRDKVSKSKRVGNHASKRVTPIDVEGEPLWEQIKKVKGLGVAKGGSN